MQSVNAVGGREISFSGVANRTCTTLTPILPEAQAEGPLWVSGQLALHSNSRTAKDTQRNPVF